jgi:small GTP-binding protein
MRRGTLRRKAKVSLIGATAVGKTSLVARYVRSIFSEQYQTTIGVRIESRVVESAAGPIELVVWDLSGEDEFQNVQPNYLRGASGYLLVVDGTRRETMDVASMLEARVRAAIGAVPFVAVLNKVDLVAQWELERADVERMRSRGWSLVEASAKTGVGVEESFALLVSLLLRREPWT